MSENIIVQHLGREYTLSKEYQDYYDLKHDPDLYTKAQGEEIAAAVLAVPVPASVPSAIEVGLVGVSLKVPGRGVGGDIAETDAARFQMTTVELPNEAGERNILYWQPGKTGPFFLLDDFVSEHHHGQVRLQVAEQSVNFLSVRGETIRTKELDPNKNIELDKQ